MNSREPNPGALCDPKDYLNPDQACAFFADYQIPLTPATLSNWRTRDIGPAYLKIGRRVLYRRRDLLAYLEYSRKETKTPPPVPAPARTPAWPVTPDQRLRRLGGYKTKAQRRDEKERLIARGLAR